MKIHKLLTASALFVTCTAGAFLSGTAQGAVSSTTGDLILAFRSNNNTTAINLEVDLGPATSFLSVPAGQTIQLNLGGAYYGSTGGLSDKDLQIQYGDGSTDSSWNSRSDLVWSVAGTNGAAGGDTLYATFPGSANNRASSSTQSTPANRITTEYSTLSGQASLTSPQAAAISSSQSGSYSVQIRNGNPGTFSKDYNYFTPTTETGVVSSGTATSAFYALPAGSGAATDLGTFALGSNGTFTYTAAAVPEPSTFAAIGLGAGILLLARRRASLKNA